MSVLGGACSVLALATGTGMFFTRTGSPVWWVLLVALIVLVVATVGCFGGFRRSAWVEDGREDADRPIPFAPPGRHPDH